MRKHKILAALLFGASATAWSANYYVVVPVPGKTAQAPAPEQPAEPVIVALSDYSLPPGPVLQSYNFDLNGLLQVSGDANFDASRVVWAISSGSLPDGLSLGLGGVVAGTPIAPGTTLFQVSATYKDVTATKGYNIVVEPTVIANFGAYRAWSDGSYSQSCTAYLAGDTAHRYAGDTGDGVYRLALNGKTVDTYCDMANGGWTLVARAVSTSAGHMTTAAVGDATAPASSSPNKLADSEINALLAGGRVMKVQGDSGAVGAYFKGAFSAVSPTNMQVATTEAGPYVATCAWVDHAGFNTWCGSTVTPAPYGASWGHRTAPGTYRGIAMGTWNKSGTVWVR